MLTIALAYVVYFLLAAGATLALFAIDEALLARRARQRPLADVVPLRPYDDRDAAA